MFSVSPQQLCISTVWNTVAVLQKDSQNTGFVWNFNLFILVFRCRQNLLKSNHIIKSSVENLLCFKTWVVDFLSYRNSPESGALTLMWFTIEVSTWQRGTQAVTASKWEIPSSWCKQAGCKWIEVSVSLAYWASSTLVSFCRQSK